MIENFDKNMINGSIEQAPSEIGTPSEDMIFAPGPQERWDTCAIRTQQHILSMFGIDIPEHDLMMDAIKHGEYEETSGGGTSIEDAGNLLERNGINVNRYKNATIAHLISELGQGHKILVGVDAFEATADSLRERIVQIQQDRIAEIPNHALLVTAVDPVTMDVNVVDPQDGALHQIPYNRFMDAWKDSHCFMVSTEQSPSEYIASHSSVSQAKKERDIMGSSGFWKEQVVPDPSTPLR